MIGDDGMKVNRLLFENTHSNPLVALTSRDIELSKDQMLLHSGGPITDLSQKSFLPALDSVRFLFFEPHVDNLPTIGSPLAGEITLGNSPPLILTKQSLQGERWVTDKEFRPQTLEEALDIISRFEIQVEENNLPIRPGGFAGILGYDLGRWSNDVRLKHTPAPGTLLGVLWRTDAWWVHERQSDELHLVALEGHPWLEQGMPELPPIMPSRKLKPRVPESESDSEHARKVEKIRDSIRGGHLYQVNYGRLWKGEMEGTPWESFLRMTQTNPAPFASWMHVADHGWSVASASPERLIKIEDGTVSTRPIKGTRARGSSEEEDLALRIEMASSTKEMAEHLMLVDLERHDLSRVCKDGTVRWSDCRIEALANVQHLVSGVEGELCDSSNVGMALSSLFPGGSITGCPKLVTMAAIDELEEAPRSAWTGSIGHINFSAGQADWNILIRTMEAHSGPIEWFATVQAGGGVVFDSSPAAEVEEARWKAAAVAEATWGFKTGFNSGELPEREVGILPLPIIGGTLGKISPKEIEFNEKFNNSRVLLVDNLDSFTNNIAEILHRQGANVSVVEGRPVNEDNSASTVDEWLRKYRPTHIILGPGPSRPEMSPRTMEIANRAIEGTLTSEGFHIPLLGWCLGHQAIGIAAGWNLVQSPLGAVHGVPSLIHHDGTGMYEELESELVLMRYNSLVLESTNTILSANAWDHTNQLIMGLHHRTLPIHGVQFHPESVGSPDGITLLTFFLSLPVVKMQPVSDSQQARQP